MSIALFRYADTLEELGAAMLLARNGLCLFLPVWFLARGWSAGCEYSQRIR
jgi:hypothetical protein